jgi:hypothetical protein
MCSVARCRREIAAIEAQIRAGHPDLEGLCLALSDWHAEIRLLQASVGLAPAGARLPHMRTGGDALASRPKPLLGAIRRESWPEAARPAAAVPGGPVEGG